MTRIPASAKRRNTGKRRVFIRARRLPYIIPPIRIYYFEPTLAMETFWVDLSKIDFGQGTPERVLKLVGGRTFTGDATAEFRRSDKPFVFLFGV